MDPVKVMIVDDERIVLDDVRELIPWEEHGFQLVSEAWDSHKAYELFELHRPRLIILDICMPALNGLELGRKILFTDPHVKLIYLTAYKDFDYVRQAMELKAASYMLKHETGHNRLLNMMVSIKQEIEREDRELRDKHKYFLQTYLPKMNVVDVIGSSSSLVSRLEKPSQHHMFALIYFEMNPCTDTKKIADRLHRIPFASITETEVTLVDVLTKENKHKPTGCASLFLFPHHSSFQKNRDLLLHVAGIVHSHFPEMHHICVQNGLEREHLSCCLDRMMEAFEYSRFVDHDRIFTPDDILEKNVEQVETMKQCLSVIKDKFDRENFSGAIEDIRHLFQRKTNMQLVEELAALLNTSRSRHAMDAILMPEYFNVRNAVDWLIGEVQASSDALQAKKKYSNHTKKAIEYIHANFHSPDITNEVVAEAIGISEPHLRQLFKKETGITFLDYITEYRMKRAMELMETGNYKIYEISVKVGYKTSQYFSFVFRKWTGKNPKHYQTYAEPELNHQG